MQENSNNVIGNVRSGTRGEKDNPVKLAYFDVHTDNSTSELSVEIFNEKYHQPNKLKIQFASQNPMKIGYQMYEGKKLKCYGNGKEARELDDKGKRKTIQCSETDCIHRKNGKCKKVGRLYFVIDKLKDEGIWCYPMGSEEGIENVSRRIERANRLGIDLTNDWYELYLRAKDTIKGKNYIPDIKKIESTNRENIETHTNNLQNNKNEENNKKQTKQQNNNYLKIIGFQKVKFENKEVPKIICIDTSSKKQELILMPESKQDILKVKAESIILPLSISTRENYAILNDYTIVKAITENMENKKVS